MQVDLFTHSVSGYVLSSLPLVLVLSIPMPGFAYRISRELTSGAKVRSLQPPIGSPPALQCAAIADFGHS